MRTSLLLIILLTFSILACNNKDCINTNNGWQLLNLTGEVKSIKQDSYKALLDSSEIIKGDKPILGLHEYAQYYASQLLIKFDSFG